MEISQLIGRKQFTVLLGKNGAGKSTLLRSIDSKGELNTRYITPERGGELKYEPSIDQSMATSEGWLDKTRRKNRFESFRQQSAAQFRNLEIFYLRADCAGMMMDEYTTLLEKVGIEPKKAAKNVVSLFMPLIRKYRHGEKTK